MGHYDGVAERIAEEREKNNEIIKPLSDEEFAASWLAAEINSLALTIDIAMKQVKHFQECLNDIDAKPNEKAVDILRFRKDDYRYKIRGNIKKTMFGEDND